MPSYLKPIGPDLLAGHLKKSIENMLSSIGHYMRVESVLRGGAV